MTRNKYIFTIIGALITASLVTGIYSAFRSNQHDGSSDTVDYEAPTQEQKQAGDSQKQSTIENGEATKPRSEGSTPTDQPGSISEQATEITVVLTRAQTDEKLITVAGYVENEINGECVLALTPDDEAASQLSYTNETSFNPANPNNVDCNTFRIQRSKLKDSGIWTAQIRYTAPGYTGVSNTMEVYP